MKRSGPLRRHVRLEHGEVKLERRAKLPPRAKRPKRYAIEGRDEAYKAWVRTQRCMVAEYLGDDRWCRGAVQAAHLGDRGMSQKAPDRTCGPLCEWHHLRDQHDHAGNATFFRGFTKAQRLDLYDEWLDVLHDRYRAQGGTLRGDAD